MKISDVSPALPYALPPIDLLRAKEDRGIATVSLADLLSSAGFNGKSATSVALGCDGVGNPVIADIAGMPHLLAAGAAGSGRAVLMRSVLTTLLMRAEPKDLRLILIDPKEVEYPVFSGVPHLLTPVVTDIAGAKEVLAWVKDEMERRFHLLAENGARSLDDYNALVRDHSEKDTLPRILVAIDEFADLIGSAREEIENTILPVAQKARAAGIHLILSTAHPTVDVLTGVIKCNFPCRVAFHVSTNVDSRVILDREGAEDLSRPDEALAILPDRPGILKLQIPQVSAAQVKEIVRFLQ